MNELKQKWIEALRSGDYEQCNGLLHSRKKDCCLGVLAKITDNPGNYPLEQLEKMWPGKDGNTLINYFIKLNDEAKLDFNEIADEIEVLEKL